MLSDFTSGTLNTDDIALVITDFYFAVGIELNGRDVAAELRERYNGLKIALCTNDSLYSDNEGIFDAILPKVPTEDWSELRKRFFMA